MLSLDDESDFDSYYLGLCVLSVIFLVIPLLTNILQLHFEISKWSKDQVLSTTPVRGWIRSRVKFLYCIAVLCGSSFSAIQLCNSYLFKLSLFSMGLSRYHKNLFQTKRFASIVLLENIPQFCIQILALILMTQEGSDLSSYMITVLSMSFTIVSIVISVFEHKMQSKFLKKGVTIVARFSFESRELAHLRLQNFDRRVKFRRFHTINSVAKSVELAKESVERLLPLQHKQGIIFTFIVELIDKSQFERVADLLSQAIKDKTLEKVE